MRDEQKHRGFTMEEHSKFAAKKYKNFKNIPEWAKKYLEEDNDEFGEDDLS